VADNNNLLVRLRRWVHRQDENFTTEAFAHVLQRLLDHESEAAARFLKHLTGGVVDLQPEEVLEVHLRTQITTAAGRPDVEIRTKRHLVYLEAKVESGLGHRQLERYRGDLLKSGFPITALVLLTRYPVVLDKLGENPDHCVRWHGLADWLAMELVGGSLRDPVSRYVIEQFIGFLSKRGMKMEEVGWEMVRGVHAMCNFLAMLAEAAAAATQCPVKPTRSAEFVGFNLEAKKYWIGLKLDEPEYLFLEAYFTPIDQEKLLALGRGEVEEESPGVWRWVDWIDLQSEEAHFFSRSRASQLQFLEQFIRESLAVAHQLGPKTVIASSNASEAEIDAPE
jgi:hypothetical protein